MSSRRRAGGPRPIRRIGTGIGVEVALALALVLALGLGLGLPVAIADSARAEDADDEPAPQVSLKSLRDGAMILDAELTMPGSPQAVWDVVTDYDRLASFMPHFKSSHVLSRNGRTVVV